MLSDARKRLAAGFRYQAESAGHQLTEAETPGEDDVGHVIVTGDINVSDPSSLQSAIGALTGQQVQQPQKTQPETPAEQAAVQPTEQKKSLTSDILKTLAAAVVGAGLTGGTLWATGAFDNESATPATTPSFTDTDTDTLTNVQAVQAYHPGDVKPEMPK